jgi:6-pyruvoyltetrahydropterin/6-carboxytetrahydropterin synthase
MFEITKEFVFDAAHYLSHAATGHPNSRLHGHSFYVEVTLRGDPDKDKGWIRDFGDIERVINDVRHDLDHRLLNEIEGLGAPTLENLSRYIFGRLKPRLPGLHHITIRRPSHRESCTYTGEA